MHIPAGDCYRILKQWKSNSFCSFIIYLIIGIWSFRWLVFVFYIYTACCSNQIVNAWIMMFENIHMILPTFEDIWEILYSLDMPLQKGDCGTSTSSVRPTEPLLDWQGPKISLFAFRKQPRGCCSKTTLS